MPAYGGRPIAGPGPGGGFITHIPHVRMRPALPTIRPGFVLFKIAGGVSIPQVVAMMYDEPKCSDGLGGWEQIPRRRRRSITEYAGGPGYTLTIPIIFDKFASQESVEPEVDTLEQLAQVAAGETEPPQVEVRSGGSIPHDYHNDPHITWVINDIDPQPGAQWNAGRKRCRYLAVVTLFQYESEGVIIRRVAKEKSVSKQRTYVLRKGDTLQKIAARYKIKGGWKAIARLNNIRDPNHPGKPGTVIKLP